MGSALAGSPRAVALGCALAWIAVCPARVRAGTEVDAVSSGSADAAAASPSSSSAAETIELQPVQVVAPPAPEPSVAEEPTASGTVVERREFAGESLHVADLLLHAAGTRVRRAPGMETLQIRGASPDQSLVLLDGISLNSLGGGGVDLRTLPAGLVDRITLIRGNEGARYGSGALGGVALLQTRSVERLTPEVALHTGSFGSYGLEGSIGAGDGASQAVVGLSLDTTRGDFRALHDATPATPGGERLLTVRNNDRSLGALLLVGRTRAGATRVDGLVLGSLSSGGLPGSLHQPTPSSRREGRRGLVALRAQRTAGDATLRGGVELRREDLSVRGETGTAEGWQQETQATLRAGLELPAGDALLVIAGASAGVDALESPAHGAPSRAQASLQLAPEISVGRTVTVTPAARFDLVGDLTALSPRLGAAWRPLRLLELRAAAGSSFRAPSFGELYFDQGPVKPNPDLRPERGYSVDGGAVLRLAGLTAQASAFFARTRDQITYEMGAFQVRPLNFLDAATLGGELELVAQPMRGVVATFAWTHARTMNLRDDPRFLEKDLPYHPRDRVLVRLSGRRSFLEGFAEGSYQSAQFTARDNAGGVLPEQLSGRAGAGVRVIREPYEVWLSGEVDNLTDARLFDQLGFYQPGRAFFFTLRAAAPGAGDS